MYSQEQQYQTYQSREDRLRDLERERELYSFNYKESVPKFDAFSPLDSFQASSVDNGHFGSSGHFHSNNDAIRYAYSESGPKTPYIDVDFERKLKSDNQPTSSSARPLTKSLHDLDSKHKTPEFSKPLKFKSKLYMSDRQQLEQANLRYGQLENAYHKLLAQVQKLQTTHLSDLRNTESRFHSASNAMQQALVSKSDELVQITNRLVSIQAKYERDSRQWEKERSIMRQQLEQLSKDFSTLDNSLRQRDKSLQESDRSRKELAERVAHREHDVIKYGKALRQREAELLAEKDTRMKLETKSIRLEDLLNQAKTELTQTKAALERKTQETADYEKNKNALEELRSELEESTRREKNYSAELEQLSARERKLFVQVEEQGSQQRKYVSEVSRLNAKLTSVNQELEVVKTVENNLRTELEETVKSKETQHKELAELELALRQQQTESFKLTRELSELHNVLQDTRSSSQTVQNEHSALRLALQQAKKELEVTLQQLEDARLKGSQADELRQQLMEITKRLEAETLAKLELRSQNKEKMLEVSHKISDLQSTMSQTKAELEDLQKNEALLRQTIKQREDTIKQQNSTIAELQNSILSLQSQNSQLTNEADTTRNKKREELQSIQDKYSLAKQQMEQEVQSLRSQLSQKQAQIASVSEEADRLRVDLSEFSADRFSLEARVSELLASEQSYQRQIANLQSALNQRNQEIQRLQSKHEFRQEDEDVQRIQTSMQQLSKRLQTQVDTLDRKSEIKK